MEETSKPGRILIADDDHSLAEALGMFLTGKGYEVTIANDGLEAARQLKKSGYDILVTDLQMPGMTGEEVLDSLGDFTDDERPGIIILTAHQSLDSAIKGIQAGVSAYIKKPFDLVELETSVGSLMEQRRLRDRLKQYYRDLDRKVEERTRELGHLNEKLKDASCELEKSINQLLILNWMGNRARVSGRHDDAAQVLVSSVGQALELDRVCLWLLDEDGKTLSLSACYGEDRLEQQDMTVDSSRLSCLPPDCCEAVVISGSICDRHSPDSPEWDPKGEVIVAPLVARGPGSREISCWDYYECGQDDCPAKKNRTLACWMQKNSCLYRGKDAATLLEKMELCRPCEVYKANTSGKIIGILCADNKSSGRAIKPGDVRTLNIFANSAATIMENVRLTERIVKNERFTDNIVQGMASGLLVTDIKGRVRMINKAGAEIFKCAREELLGVEITKMYKETARMIDEEDRSALKEIIIQTSDGPVPIGYINSQLVGQDDEADGSIVVFKDLSEIKKLQGLLREREHFSALGKVAAGVAHEIRNPLFGITSVAQILAREAGEGDPHKALIEAMLSETARLNKLVEEMLLYGRTMKLSTKPVDLSSLVEDVLAFHAPVIAGKGLKVSRHFDMDLPVLMLDPNQMRQLMLNLLVNAIDASGRDGEISISVNKNDDNVSVKVSDSGIGIPKEDIAKVFDLFYTTKEKGTGLGLAISRRIVQEHRGDIFIESTAGKGTTTIVVLPCAMKREGEV